jgi:hypothetical protein
MHSLVLIAIECRVLGIPISVFQSRSEGQTAESKYGFQKAKNHRGHALSSLDESA